MTKAPHRLTSVIGSSKRSSRSSNVPKPDWVDAQLAALDMQRVPLDGNPRMPAGCRREVKAKTVSELCEHGHLPQAVDALGVLVLTGCEVSRSLLYRVLKECLARKDLPLGRRVHALTVKKGYESDTFLCNHILRMYASHARLQEARDVFTMATEPDAFTWSAIISAHVKHKQDKQAIQLYHELCRSSVKPDGHVFVAALQACARAGDLESGQQVHADVLASGVQGDLFVCSCLVDMYTKCGSLEHAQRVFDGLPEKNVVVWSAMIAGYTQQGKGQEALQLYRCMQEEGFVAPDSVTFVYLLQACSGLGTPALDHGKKLHAQIREARLEADVFVANSLVDMYAKCGSLDDARDVFDGLIQKTVVTWSAMIAGYSHQGMAQEALRLYRAMEDEGMVSPNAVTYVCLLQACSSVGAPALETGKQLHAQLMERGHEADVFIASSLVYMYAKCGSLEDAQRVFDGLPQKDLVTWSAMITGYSQQDMGQEALALFRDMQEEGVVAPNVVTFVCLLQACGSLADLRMGRQLHAQIKEQGLQADLPVARSLISMYGKCSSMVDAQQAFEALSKRDVVIWSALIAGYTHQGDSEKVFDLVLKMTDDGIQPDSITFLSVLKVCGHTGQVNKGREYFEAMREQYHITPTADHYTCMVDLFGRAGQLDEALALVKTMPVPPDAAVWHTLLGACRKWSNVDVGRRAFDEAVNLDNKDSAAYVLMSNIYTDAQMWEQAQEMQVRRTKNGAWKQPGQSWWTDTDGLLHSFFVEDTQHIEADGGCP